MPRTPSESITDEEDSQGDGYCECNEAGNSANREDGQDGRFAGKDEQAEQDADGAVEPDGINGCLGERIHFAPES